MVMPCFGLHPASPPPLGYLTGTRQGTLIGGQPTLVEQCQGAEMGENERRCCPFFLGEEALSSSFPSVGSQPQSYT